jgi:hypothetical protein
VSGPSTTAPARFAGIFSLGAAAKAGILAIFSLFYFSDILFSINFGPDGKRLVQRVD